MRGGGGESLFLYLFWRKGKSISKRGGGGKGGGDRRILVEQLGLRTANRLFLDRRECGTKRGKSPMRRAPSSV